MEYYAPSLSESHSSARDCRAVLLSRGIWSMETAHWSGKAFLGQFWTPQIDLFIQREHTIPCVLLCLLTITLMLPTHFALAKQTLAGRNCAAPVQPTMAPTNTLHPQGHRELFHFHTHHQALWAWPMRGPQQTSLRMSFQPFKVQGLLSCLSLNES